MEIKKYEVKVKEVEVITHPQNVNNIVGYKRENVEKLKTMYDVDMVILQDIKASPDKIEVFVSKKYTDFNDESDSFESKKAKKRKSKIETEKKTK